MMEIGRFLPYKGHIGSIEYDFRNETYFGKLLNVNDTITYQADNVMDLYDNYHDTVNCYIEIKGKTNG